MRYHDNEASRLDADTDAGMEEEAALIERGAAEKSRAAQVTALSEDGINYAALTALMASDHWHSLLLTDTDKAAEMLDYAQLIVARLYDSR